MINLEKLIKKPKVFKRLTGLSPAKFKFLVAELEPRFKQANIKRLSQRKRQRKIGGGSKFKLSAAQALFMILIYYRTYVFHVFLGSLFGIDESNVGRYCKRIEPLLAGIFKIPERKIKISEQEILELLFDATEQETEKRPGSSWSGKANKNTIKTQIVVNPKGKIKSVSKSIKGSVHDKKLYDEAKVFTNIKVRRKADLGYVGTTCEIPIKKQPNIKLTEKQKLFNKQFSKERIKIEHVICHLKKFKILSYKFRNRLNNYNLIFRNIAGLRNLQMQPEALFAQ